LSFRGLQPAALDKRDKQPTRLEAANRRDLSLHEIESNKRGTNVQLQTSAKDQLRAFVARIERLEEEKAALAADLREVYAEAKGTGFDVKALRTVIRMRKQDENKRREEGAVLATYLHALGMAEAEAA
jgi:uncharacterized protein (UPF0335 family)